MQIPAADPLSAVRHVSRCVNQAAAVGYMLLSGLGFGLGNTNRLLKSFQDADLPVSINKNQYGELQNFIVPDLWKKILMINLLP